MKNKTIALVLAALLCIGFTGCEMMEEILEVVERHADPDASATQEDTGTWGDSEESESTGFGTNEPPAQQNSGSTRPQRAEDVVVSDVSIIPPEGFSLVPDAADYLDEGLVFAYSPSGTMDDSTFIYFMKEDWQPFDKSLFFDEIEQSMDEYKGLADAFHYDKQDIQLDGWPAYYYEIQVSEGGVDYVIAEAGLVLDNTYVLFLLDETGNDGYLTQFKRFIEDFEFVYD